MLLLRLQIGCICLHLFVMARSTPLVVFNSQSSIFSQTNHVFHILGKSGLPVSKKYAFYDPFTLGQNTELPLYALTSGAP